MAAKRSNLSKESTPYIIFNILGVKVVQWVKVLHSK